MLLQNGERPAAVWSHRNALRRTDQKPTLLRMRVPLLPPDYIPEVPPLAVSALHHPTAEQHKYREWKPGYCYSRPPITP